MKQGEKRSTRQSLSVETDRRVEHRLFDGTGEQGRKKEVVIFVLWGDRASQNSSALELTGEALEGLYIMSNVNMCRLSIKTYRLRDCALVVKVLAKATNELELLVNGQAVDRGLDDITNGNLINSDKAVVVHEGKETHDELAIHAIGDTTVTRNRLAKVLDVEGALQTRGKESTERSNERGKSSESEDVELHGLNVESLVDAEQFEGEGLGDKSRVQGAFQASQDVRSKVIDRADEVLVAHQNVGHEVAEDDGANPSTEETLNSLLGGQLNQLCASEGDTADVSEDIIGDDQRGGKEEPNHALEDVVHHEVGLHNNEVQCHMGPGELGKLKSVVTLLQRSNEEHKAYIN